MTLQSSGQITLGNVQGEFGGANPISISEYCNAASGVPASGTIALSHFYGKSSPNHFTFVGVQRSSSIFGFAKGTAGSTTQPTMTYPTYEIITISAAKYTNTSTYQVVLEFASASASSLGNIKFTNKDTGALVIYPSSGSTYNIQNIGSTYYHRFTYNTTLANMNNVIPPVAGVSNNMSISY